MLKCLMKYEWVKLRRDTLPTGKGIMGAWARLAARAAFRHGHAYYCGYKNAVSPGMWSGGIVGLKSILGIKSRTQAFIMSKQDELQYEQQEKRIQAQSDAFITLLTKRGILGDSRIDDAQKRAARQEKTKNCYHNTLMLLQHYRTLVWMLECFPETVAAELDRPFEGVDKLIEDVDVEVALGNKKIESRMQGMQKSRLLMDRLNEALTVLRKKPDNGERLYNLIYTTYIAPDVLNHQEILYRLTLSSRNYYRLRQQAISVLSIRLWATAAPDVDFWLEMLTLIEGLE